MYQQAQLRPEEDIESGMERIRKFFEQKLNFFDSPSTAGTEEKILTETSLDGIVDYIAKNNVTKIITMAGAGISTCKCSMHSKDFIFLVSAKLQ